MSATLTKCPCCLEQLAGRIENHCDERPCGWVRCECGAVCAPMRHRGPHECGRSIRHEVGA